jgi:hypothetical protein
MKYESDVLDTEVHPQLSGTFSGLFSAAIVKMNGIAGKPGWAWIFILVYFAILFFLFFTVLNPFHTGRIAFCSRR